MSVAVGLGHAHQEELRARIERMLANDDDMRRFGAALSYLTALRPANRAFAQDRLIELAFGPLLDQIRRAGRDVANADQFSGGAVSGRGPRAPRRCSSATRR